MARRTERNENPRLPRGIGAAIRIPRDAEDEWWSVLGPKAASRKDLDVLAQNGHFLSIPIRNWKRFSVCTTWSGTLCVRKLSILGFSKIPPTRLSSGSNDCFEVALHPVDP
jgi:hypothetical protein